jgi:phenylalanyl-tRNA synthetase alpha chain
MRDNPRRMQDPTSEIEAIRAQADSELAAASSVDALEQWRIKYLGTKGILKDLMKLLGKAPAAERPKLGQQINGVKESLTSVFEAKKLDASAAMTAGQDAIDVTEPGKSNPVGRPHVITKVVDELLELFGRLGFATATGPELEDDWHNFVALNIPASHPARDPNDNFYLQGQGDTASGTGVLLRTQTSTVQIRIMETQKPPIRVVIPGRVYRPDTIDATHLPMFHQLEALVVDRGVTMVDLKSTVLQFVKGYFGQETKIRFRPSFFPFTEPSAEVDVWFEDKQRWIELGGCGMVHPNVLTNCGIDPAEYSGWAFGFGVERIAMRKYAIPDIRLLVENDLRFLSQL